MTDQETKALYIAQKCVAAGMTLAGAAGVLVNIQHESVFSSINVEDRYHSDTKQTDEHYTQMVDTNAAYDFANDGGRHYGYGLCQWTYPTRKTELRRICREKGVSIGDRDTQIEFMFSELKRDFPVVWKALTSSTSAYNCAWQFCRWYENPANPEATAEYRASKADPWYNFIVQHIKDDVPDPEPQPDPEPKEDHSLSLRMIDWHCESWDEYRLLVDILRLRKYNVDDFDDEVWDALEDFQRDNGLEPDRIAGPKTWDALLKRT